jgi:hypothetical protein
MRPADKTLASLFVEVSFSKTEGRFFEKALIENTLTPMLW